MPAWKKVFVEAPGTWTGPSPPMKLVVEEKELPTPGVGEVLLKHLCGGLAWADTMMAEGKYFDVKASQYPIVLGYDSICQVISVGSGVSLKPDSLVAVLSVYGSLQSYSVRSADDLVPVPEGLDPAEAVSMVLNYVTAYQMIHRTGVSLKPDSEDLVVVHAASGGVGTALLDILRAEFPKAKVLGTSSPGKKEMVLSHGAQHCDYTSEDFAAKIKQLAPNGAKAIFDAVGSANAIKSYSSLSKDGGLVVYGFTQDVASNSNMLWAILKVASRVFIPAKLAGLFGGKYTADMYVVTQFKDKSLANFKTDLGKLFEMAKEGKLHPEVQAVCSIDEALDVYAFFRKGGSRGKLVLAIDEDYKAKLEKEGRLKKASELK